MGLKPRHRWGVSPCPSLCIRRGRCTRNVRAHRCASVCAHTHFAALADSTSVSSQLPGLIPQCRWVPACRRAALLVLYAARVNVTRTGVLTRICRTGPKAVKISCLLKHSCIYFCSRLLKIITHYEQYSNQYNMKS